MARFLLMASLVGGAAAATWTSPWTACWVALFAQGIPTAASLGLQVATQDAFRAVPASGTLELELVASDATATTWPSTVGGLIASFSGNAAKNDDVGGVVAVDVRGSSDTARVNGLNIGPAAKPQLTIEMWVYMHSKDGYVGWASGPDEGGGYDRSIVLHDIRFHGISLCVGHAGWGSNINMPLQTWTHLVGTWDQGNYAYLYVNGVQYGPEPVTKNEQGNYFLIGNRFAGDWQYNTDISVSAVRVWSSILGQSDVDELYARGASGAAGQLQPPTPAPTAAPTPAPTPAPTGSWYAGPTSTSCASFCATLGLTCEDRVISTQAEMESIAESLDMLSTQSGLAADSGGYAGAKCIGYSDGNGHAWSGLRAWYRSRPSHGPCYFDYTVSGVQDHCQHSWGKTTDAPFCYCSGLPNPTAAPTPATPPPASGAGAGASAVGDPHLQNIHGERFDLMQAGKHVLINVPRGMSAENALLRVQAAARRLGGQCADMYFQQLNVTGSWAEVKQAGGYHYSVSQHDAKGPEWVAFGKVELKVVHGRTDSGLLYLNLYVKHLGRAGFAVGGLLGEDDHGDVSAAPDSCAQRLALVAGTRGGRGPEVASVAVASLA
ncbi:unnamed protein product [Prorocentrum cordatum]|uniref:Uncharacterized protein n=1 Tax=Prorocentrum cordatum TaxID=2364126 RepID=A0ABN9RJ69_9DINO|nr:unnamed protein product [Polarella glacialis]